jgi:hypothetical protein
MFKARLARLTLRILGLVFLCLFVCSLPPAYADSIINVSLAGAIGPYVSFGLPFFPGACSSLPAGTTVTGSYSFDQTTDSIAGPWSFSTFFGTMSPSSSTVSYGVSPFDRDTLSLNSGLISLELTFDNPEEYGALAPGQSYVLSANEQCHVHTCTALYVTSGEASVVAATPEPTTLLLLVVGRLSFAPLLRGHFIAPLIRASA